MTPEPPKQPSAAEPPKLLRNLGPVGLAGSMTVGLVLFTWLGYVGGKRYDQPAIGILIGVSVGLFYCGYEIWKIVRRSNRELANPLDTKA